MILRLKNYLDDEFANVKSSQKVEDLKEELLANLVDKYEELLHNGYSEDKAFVEAIKSIGDLDEILSIYRLNIHESEKIRDVETILYKYKNDDDYIFEKTMAKVNKTFSVAFGIALLSLLLFFPLTLLTYYEMIGFTVQIVLLILSYVLFLLSFTELTNITKNVQGIFKNKLLYLKGIKYQKKVSFIAYCFIINSILLTIPYLLFDNSEYVKSILTFSSYLSVVWAFMLMGLVISVALYFFIDERYYQKIIQYYPQEPKPKLLSKIFTFYKYLVYIFLAVLIVIVPNEWEPINTLLMWFFIISLLYNVISLIFKKNEIHLRLLNLSVLLLISFVFPFSYWFSAMDQLYFILVLAMFLCFFWFLIVTVVLLIQSKITKLKLTFLLNTLAIIIIFFSGMYLNGNHFVILKIVFLTILCLDLLKYIFIK